MSYWHGGIPRLKVGEFILPPATTGTSRCLYRYANEIAPETPNGSRVYVTTERKSAKAFAALYPKGSLYRVEPEGELELDPDNEDGTSFRCSRARIVAVYDRLVNIPFEKALRMLEAS